MPVYLQQNGEQAGPFEDADVVRLLEEGTLSLNQLAWEYGLADWVPLGKIREFGSAAIGLPRTPPPIRPPQPPPLPVLRAETNPVAVQPPSKRSGTRRFVMGCGCMVVLGFLGLVALVIIGESTSKSSGTSYSAPASPQSSREEPRTESQSGLGGVLSAMLESESERHARISRQLLGVWDSEDGWQRMEFKPDGRIIMTELKEPNTPATTGHYVLNANATLLIVRLDGLAGKVLDALDSNEDTWLLIFSNDRMILPRPLAGTAYRRAK